MDKCICNRPKDKPHCVRCGAASVLCVQKLARLDKLPDGTKFIVKGYRCRTCGQVFHEDSPCAAPLKHLGAAPRSKSQLDKAVEALPNKEARLAQAREAVMKLLEQRGLKAQEEPVRERNEDGSYRDEFFGR